MSDLTVQQAHKNFEKIIILVKDITQRWLFLGQLLWENREKGYWEKLGHESFNSFLAAPELGLSPTTHYKFIHLYELYCLKLLALEIQLSLLVGLILSFIIIRRS